MKPDHHPDHEIATAVMRAADHELPFRRWSPILQALWVAETDMRRRRDLVFVYSIGLMVGLACLPLDYIAGPEIFETGLYLRLGLVAPVYLLAILAARFGSSGFNRIACVLPVPFFATVGAYLGMHPVNPLMSEYVMSVGLLVTLASVISPLRPAYIIAVSGLSLVGLWTVFATIPQGGSTKELILLIFISVICAVTLAIPLRTTRLKDQNFLFTLRSRLMSDRLVVANEQLRELSHRDDLTGLPNRRYFERIFETALRGSIDRDDDLAVMMIDVDNFKAFNDTHGHLAGDRALRQVATELEKQFSAPGQTVARYGGEEFVVVVEGCNAEAALHLADRARRAVAARPVKLGRDRRARLTVSIGVSLRKVAGSAAPELLGCADEALYEAKLAGRDLVRLAGHEECDRPSPILQKSA